MGATHLEVPGFRIHRMIRDSREKYIRLECFPLPAGAAADRELLLFPGSRRVIVKTVETQGERYLITVKGAGRRDLRSGSVLVDALWPILETREALLFNDGFEVSRRQTLVRGGVTPEFNDERFIGPATVTSDGPFLRVRFPRAYPLMPGLRVLLENEEAGVRSFTVLFSEPVNADQRRRLHNTARRRPNPNPDPVELYGRLLHIFGYLQLPPPLQKADFEKAENIGNWVILSDRARRIEKALVRAASKPGGVEREQLKIESYPRSLLRVLADDLCSRADLREREGWYFPPGDPPLSPFHRSWLAKVRDAGEAGLRKRSGSLPADHQALEALERSGLIFGGETIWFSGESVESMARDLFSGRTSGDTLVISDVKDCLGVSRSVALDFLHILEDLGKLKLGSDGVTRYLP